MKIPRLLLIHSIHSLWLMIFIISLFSGLMIATDHRQWLTPIKSWLISGDVFTWHFFSAAILIASLLAYGFVFIKTKRWRIFAEKNLSKTISLIGLFLLIALSVSGLILNFFPNRSVRDWHFIIASIFLLYPLLHIISQLLDKHWLIVLKIFGWGKTTYLFSGLALLIISFLIAQPVITGSKKNLQVHYVNTLPTVDGKENDKIWQAIKRKTIITQLSEAKYDVPVTIKAVHNKEHIVFLIRWPDPEPSYNHLPLEFFKGKFVKGKFVKGQAPNGAWQAANNGFSTDDEKTYYEDKLAIMLANKPLAAIKSIHLGKKPLSNAPEPRHQRGYHYTTDQSYLDIWHWKAVRSDLYFQADDNFFGPPIPINNNAPRYLAGYQKDPSWSGGVINNYEFFNKNTITPLRIPSSSRYVSNSGNKQIKQTMRWVDSEKYQAELMHSRFKEGQQIPSIIHMGAYEGDRGDVGAKGHWENGYWTVELMRKLDTQSPYDVSIKNNTYMWFATFNHSQTRHSYHLWPLKLKLLNKSN